MDGGHRRLHCAVQPANSQECRRQSKNFTDDGNNSHMNKSKVKAPTSDAPVSRSSRRMCLQVLIHHPGTSGLLSHHWNYHHSHLVH
ncbi:hypothetical protein BDW66DRAFT_145460 [Aspergillus desertorum]